MMLDMVVDVGLIALSIAVVLCFYRVMKGPSVPDRALALDTITTNFLGIILLMAIRLRSELYFEVVLVLAILGFLGTTALAKFIAKGVIIDRDNN